MIQIIEDVKLHVCTLFYVYFSVTPLAICPLNLTEKIKFSFLFFILHVGSRVVILNSIDGIYNDL